MRLPNKLKIGSRKFDVFYDDKLGSNSNFDGQILYSSGYININSGAPRDRQEECLMHEIVHAAMILTGLDDRLKAINENLVEDVTSSLTSSLYQILNDNKMLAE